MPVTVLHDTLSKESFSLDVVNLNLAKVYEFVQEHSRLSTSECRGVVEQIVLAAMKSGKYSLDEETLNLFSNSIKALDVGSPTTFVLTTILLKLLAKKKK
jgi:DNA polymerase-3 subunit delta'